MADKTRWDRVTDKLLGSGGQGTVYLVRDKQKANIEGLEQKARALLQHFSAGFRNSDQRSQFPDFCKLLRSLENIDHPSNLGALKELHRQEDARDPERADERLQREIRGMREVEHSSLLRIVDTDEKTWYVSEFHPNGTLDKNIGVCRLDILKAVRLLRPVIEGVSLLHKAGMVHRDIKPHNLFAGTENQIVLGDFGLVFFADAHHKRLSGTFENVGTKDWMPGWALQQRIDQVKPTFDVFALGKVLWAMITGRPSLPLWYYDEEGNNIEELLPNDPLAKAVNRLLGKCVVQREKDCLADAGELLENVDEFLQIAGSKATLFEGSTVRKCLVCGVGQYIELSRNQMENSGIKWPSGSSEKKAFACDNCGHIQEFLKRDDNAPRLWGNLSAK
jgi:serine/threonine protein kinase